MDDTALVVLAAMDTAIVEYPKQNSLHLAGLFKLPRGERDGHFHGCTPRGSFGGVLFAGAPPGVIFRASSHKQDVMHKRTVWKLAGSCSRLSKTLHVSCSLGPAFARLFSRWTSFPFRFITLLICSGVIPRALNSSRFMVLSSLCTVGGVFLGFSKCSVKTLSAFFF